MGSLIRAEDLGPVPASFIRDETHLLDEKNAQALGHALQDARERFGVTVYVAAYPYISSGGTVRDRALELANFWCGEEPGLVIAVNRGTSQAGIAASAELWRRYPPDETVLALADATDLLMKPNTAPEDRVSLAVHSVLTHLAKMEEIRSAREQPMTRGEIHLAELFAAVLTAFGLIVWLGVTVWRRHEAARTALFFPDVEVGTRLGAPFGGGVIGIAGEEES
jgi:uncharacterized membrane protein YgcG